MTYADAITQVVEVSAPLMKAVGFRKRRHSFNRPAEDGLIHHLSFQMGASNPPGTVEIPGLRPNLYGKFTINLGVYVPAMRRSQPAREGWINAYNCNLRYRIGELLPERSDVWWRLDHPDAARDSSHAIADHALPWLDSLSSNLDVIDAFEQSGVAHLGMNASGALDVADLYIDLGQRELAREVLSHYVQEQMVGHHVPYVAAYLTERDLDDLIPTLHAANPPLHSSGSKRA